MSHLKSRTTRKINIIMHAALCRPIMRRLSIRRSLSINASKRALSTNLVYPSNLITLTTLAHTCTIGQPPNQTHHCLHALLTSVWALKNNKTTFHWAASPVDEIQDHQSMFRWSGDRQPEKYRTRTLIQIWWRSALTLPLGNSYNSRSSRHIKDTCRVLQTCMSIKSSARQLCRINSKKQVSLIWVKWTANRLRPPLKTNLCSETFTGITTVNRYSKAKIQNMTSNILTKAKSNTMSRHLAELKIV